MKGKLKLAAYFLVVSSALGPIKAGAQTDSTSLSAVPEKRVNLDSLVSVAEGLRSEYRFEESCNLFYDIISQEQDSLKKVSYTDKKVISQNGLAMTGFVASPEVIARKKLSLEDFYLYYPLPDKSWRPFPNVLDTLAAELPVNAVYAPEDALSIYFPAHTVSGSRNIYKTEKGDSLWTVPVWIGEGQTSFSDDIFPMLSADRKTLYFSSEGLFGAGGYDLYFSEWNEEKTQWGEPQNMGFPYSSPFNDYLYMNSPDGEYTLFASDRGCSSDSVWLYVLTYDPLPVRTEVKSPEELRNLCSLIPPTEGDAQEKMNSNVPENLDIRRYMDKIAQVNALRDSIYTVTVRRDQQKNDYAVSDDVEKRELLTLSIEENEKEILLLQDSLEVARKKLQDIEMEFLFSGVVIDPQKLMEEAEKESVPEKKKYVFRKKEMGDSLVLAMEQPVIPFDYTFCVRDTAVFAPDQKLPEGIVYQILFMTVKDKASVKECKGLSPVYEVSAGEQGWIYRTGLFCSYEEAAEQLETVKKLGFRDALVVAFKDAVPISVSAARNPQAVTTMYEVLFEEETGAPFLEQVAALSGKDIAKSERNGKIVYIVGPFEVKTDADTVCGYLAGNGVGAVLNEIVK